MIYCQKMNGRKRLPNTIRQSKNKIKMFSLNVYQNCIDQTNCICIFLRKYVAHFCHVVKFLLNFDQGCFLSFALKLNCVCLLGHLYTNITGCSLHWTHVSLGSLGALLSGPLMIYKQHMMALLQFIWPKIAELYSLRYTFQSPI